MSFREELSEIITHTGLTQEQAGAVIDRVAERISDDLDPDCECGHALEDHRSRSSNCEAPGCDCELYEFHA